MASQAHQLGKVRMRRFFVFFLLLLALAAKAGNAQRKFVSLSPSITEIFFAIGAEDSLVGVVAPADYPPKASEKEVVAGYDYVRYERMFALGADECLTTEGMQDRETLKRIGELKIKVVEYRMGGLEDMFASIIDIGARTGREEAAERLVARLRSELDTTIRGNPQEKRRAVFVAGVDPLIVAGKGTFLNDVLDKAGLVNAFKERSPSYFAASPELIVEAKPEFLVLPGGEISAEDRESLLSRLKPFIGGVRVLEVDADLIARPSPRVVEGVKELAREVKKGGSG